MTKSRNIAPPRRQFTEVEIELIRRNYADSLTEDIARALGRPTGSIHQKARKLGLSKSPEFVAEKAREAMLDPNHGGRKVQFPKGNVPANKGLRRPGYSPGDMAKTQFKKGQMPHTWMPVGSYRINPDGYVERKFGEEPGPYYMRWKPVHRQVWEDAHGPIPPDHVVAFLPGRKTTDPELITLDALELESRSEMARRNSVHNLPKPLAELVQLRGVLTRQINKKAKASA